MRNAILWCLSYPFGLLAMLIAWLTPEAKEESTLEPVIVQPLTTEPYVDKFKDCSQVWEQVNQVGMIHKAIIETNGKPYSS